MEQGRHDHALHLRVVFRWLGFTAVIYSVRTIQHPKAEEYTGPISVTMQRVINLAMPYFLGFLRIWTVVSVEELTC